MNIIQNYRQYQEINAHVDVFDSWCWSHGTIKMITMPFEGQQIFRLHIIFKNWSDQWTTKIDIAGPDYNGPTNWQNGGDNGVIENNRIAPLDTKRFTTWDTPFTTPSWVRFWYEGRWERARIKSQTTETVGISLLKWRRNRPVLKEPFGSPRVREMCWKDDVFKLQTDAIKKEIRDFETELVRKEKERKEALKKERKRKRKALLTELRKDKSKVVLNDITVEYLKTSAKRVCLKSCIAFKRGWINRYGIPNSWLSSQHEKESLIVRKIHCMTNYLTDFMDRNSLIKMMQTNRFYHRTLHDPDTLETLCCRVIRRSQIAHDSNIDALHKIRSIRKSTKDWKNPIDDILRGAQSMKNISWVDTITCERDWQNMRTAMSKLEKFKSDIIVLKKQRDDTDRQRKNAQSLSKYLSFCLKRV